jgi:glutaredoxin-like protein NrdH
MVTVYSKPECVQCNSTKNVLKKLGIPYVEVDVSVDADAYNTLIEAGFVGVPVVKTDDDTWVGFRPDRIKALLGSSPDSQQPAATPPGASSHHMAEQSLQQPVAC